MAAGSISRKGGEQEGLDSRAIHGDSSDDDEEAGYQDVHRMILQEFMSKGLLGPTAVRGLFKEVWSRCGKEVPAEQEMNMIQKTVREINSKISRFNLVIKTAVCEFTGKLSYMFCLTVDTQLMKMQTYFNKVEVELFRKCLEVILEQSQDFTVEEIDCLNFNLQMDGKVTLAHTTAFLEKMIHHKYLIRHRITPNAEEFNITLGIRSILELEPLISQSFPNVLKHCELCKRIMLHGYKCRHCPYLLHIYCYKKYVKNSKKCPSCKEEWEDESSMLRRKKQNDGRMDDAEPIVPVSDTIVEDMDTQELDTQPTPPPPRPSSSRIHPIPDTTV